MYRSAAGLRVHVVVIRAVALFTRSRPCTTQIPTIPVRAFTVPSGNSSGIIITLDLAARAVAATGCPVPRPALASPAYRLPPWGLGLVGLGSALLRVLVTPVAGAWPGPGAPATQRALPPRARPGSAPPALLPLLCPCAALPRHGQATSRPSNGTQSYYHVHYTFSFSS